MKIADRQSDRVSDDIEVGDIEAPSRGSSGYSPVRSVLRAFRVLEEVNRLGQARLPEIVKAIDLPRATVVRMLDTLQAANLICRHPENGIYQATPRVHLLSAGFNFNLWLESSTTPILMRLLRRIGWPSDILRLNGREMIVSHSNRANSAININPRFIGMRSPIIGSASGRAYLAWCPEQEREHLINVVCNLQDQRRIRAEIKHTRAAGYGARDVSLPPNVGAIAVPVTLGDRVVCCIDTVFLPQVTTAPEVARKCIEPLREAAAEIAAEIAAAMPTDLAWAEPVCSPDE